MKIATILFLFSFSFLSYSQKSPKGIFQNIQLEIQFYEDSTFLYKNRFGLNPVGNKVDYNYTEKGKWIMVDDTIILNPQLKKKSFGKNEIIENNIKDADKLYFQFNIIRKQYDKNNKIYNIDTLQIESLDIAINSFNKKSRVRITQNPTTRCAFAGFIPKEIITDERSFEFEKPKEKLTKIYMRSSDLGKLMEYKIKNPNSNSFTLNIYQYIYDDGMIRDIKYLMVSENTILIEQKPNKKFRKDGLNYEYYQLKRK